MAGVASAADGESTSGMSRVEAAQVKRDANTKMLLEGPVGSTLTKLATPNVVAMLVAAANSIAEVWFASQLGVSALVGLALVFPLAMLMQMLSGASIGGAAASAVARSLGAKDVDRAERLMLHIWIIACCASFVAAAIMGVFGRELFTLLGGKGDALEQALEFSYILFPGSIFIWLCHMSLCIIRGTGKMTLSSMVLMIGSLIAIPLQGGLALGWGPLPKMGLAGLAAGTIISFALCAVFSMGYIALGYAGLSIRNTLKMPRGELFWDILKVGLLASISSVQNIATAVIILGFVGQFGQDAIAGFGLGTRLEFLMMPIIFGIGSAMTTMVGANIGAGQKARALQVGWTGAAAASLILGSFGLFFAVFPDLWLGLYLAGSEVKAFEAGRLYFYVVAPVYVFFGLGMSMFFASQGAGKVFWPVAANILRTFIVIGLGYLLAIHLEYGLIGVFAGVAVGLTFYGTMAAVAIRITGWR